MTTAKQLKQQMAIPPIPQAPKKDRHGKRDRTRIRMEISQDQCKAFIEFLREELTKIGTESPRFQPMYDLYYSMKVQLGKVTKNANKD